jgi:peptidoglycan hydrolase CwlO-like protein
LIQKCKLFINSLIKDRITNKEGSELSPSRKKLLKKIDKAIEALDNQINNPYGIDENKLKELIEMREKLEKSKKDIKRRSFDLSLPV